jgi:hypothetical protein
MNKKEEFLEKHDALMKSNGEIKLLVTVMKLPYGSYETIVNTDKLEDKVEYIMRNYDNDLRLKLNDQIMIMDYIIL